MLLDNLPDLCTIQRRTRTNSPLGGNKESRVVEQTNVPCWIQQMNASEIVMYQKRGINVDQKIYFTKNPQVDERHEIVITQRNGGCTPAPNQILEVYSQAVPDASAGFDILFRVIGNFKTGKQN